MSEADGARICPGCGAEAGGNFCSNCGTSLAGPAACAACGARLSSGALYCAECGQAVATPRKKPASARLPWILSALALAAFSVVIALLVQRNSTARRGDMLPTGGIATGQDAGGAPAASGMPSMEELVALGPRGAADRLYERAMSEHEAGNAGQTRFVRMALQAYGVVPPAEMDADARFHIGMLHLVAGDSAGARASGAEILSRDAEHLLGHILMARVEDFANEPAAAAAHRAEVRRIVDAAGGIPDRPEYEAHRPIIERELEDGDA